MKFARKKVVEDGLGEGDVRREMAGCRGWPLQNFFGGEMSKGASGASGGRGASGARGSKEKGRNRDAV